MKFRFCGDLDCPDWVLAEISILSKMTSIKIRQLCNQIVTFLLTGDMNYDPVHKIASDAKFELSDAKAIVSAISFILTNATRHSVDGETLSNELQQLGLPKENSGALCKIYSDNCEKLTLALKEKSLRLSKLEKFEWRVDYVLSSSVMLEVSQPSYELKLVKSHGVSGEIENVVITVSRDKFRSLLTELKQAYKIMEGTS